MKTIKYIGFYPKDKDGFMRMGSIAAGNKMDYICSAINAAGYKVNIISPSWFADNKRKYSNKYIINESNMKAITFAPSVIANNRITRRIRAVFSKIWLFVFLINNTKRNENIIVYHSLFLIRPVLLAKRIRKFNIILESNEIYSDVKKYSNRIERLEFNMFSSADKYIFSTELLNVKLNKHNKPFAVNYGTYLVEEDRKCKFNDGKIHVVYAGIIDNEKGGAAAAAAAAKYLGSNYHIHIIGFGSEKDIKKLIDLVNDISKETECILTYDGLKTGDNYIDFIQKCDIGLSTQTPDAAYNETSFPSKVLSYLSNGLRVVSIKIKSIEQSKVGRLLYFYNINSPKEIANAINKIDFSLPYNSRKILKIMNDSFIKEIGDLLNEK